MEQLAVHLRHRGEEAAGGAQEGDVSLDAVADRLVGLLGGGLEAELVALARGLRDVVGGGHAAQGEHGQERPGQRRPATGVRVPRWPSWGRFKPIAGARAAPRGRLANAGRVKLARFGMDS